MSVGLFTLFFLLGTTAQAIQVIPENTPSGVGSLDRDLPVGVCTEIKLGRSRELPIYKDFTVLGLIDLSSTDGVGERPLLGSFSGTLFISRLGPARRLKNLDFLAHLVGRQNRAVNPESLFVPAMLCGENSYQGSLGYFELSAFKTALQDEFDDRLPPSTLSNPIPRLKTENN